MTSKEPTATDEIQGRIETLGRQIEQRLEDAATSMSNAANDTREADRLTVLRDGYIKLLAAAHAPTPVVISEPQIHDPANYAAQVLRHTSRNGR